MATSLVLQPEATRRSAFSRHERFIHRSSIRKHARCNRKRRDDGKLKDDRRLSKKQKKASAQEEGVRDSTVFGLELVNTFDVDPSAPSASSGVTAISMDIEMVVLFAGTGGWPWKLKAWDGYVSTESGSATLEAPVKSLVHGRGFVFAATGCEVLAWGKSSSAQPTLRAHETSELNVLAFAEEGFLVAGLSSGKVCAWSFSGCSDLDLQGRSLCWDRHPTAVTALAVAEGRVYSGSGGGGICACEIGTGQICVNYIDAHDDKVTGLLRWDSLLISCSLDGWIKIWGETTDGSLEEYFAFEEGGEFGGVSGMCKTVDAHKKPVLVCSFSGSQVVKVYDLPSFKERGHMLSMAEVTSLAVVPEGDFIFTGDKRGVNVWRWSDI